MALSTTTDSVPVSLSLLAATVAPALMATILIRLADLATLINAADMARATLSATVFATQDSLVLLAALVFRSVMVPTASSVFLQIVLATLATLRMVNVSALAPTSCLTVATASRVTGDQAVKFARDSMDNYHAQEVESAWKAELAMAVAFATLTLLIMAQPVTHLPSPS